MVFCKPDLILEVLSEANATCHKNIRLVQKAQSQHLSWHRAVSTAVTLLPSQN